MQRSLVCLVMVLSALCSTSTAQATGPTGLLNDTGQTQCDNGVNVMEACSSSNTGDSSLMPGQDGRFGRDAASSTKIGGGLAGFDFTKVCWNGNAQGSGTCTGTLVANTGAAPSSNPFTDWACTRDNVTNLYWSTQTQSATWSNAISGNYPNAGHNTPARCGFSSGWRLPTRRELLGIVDNGNPSVAFDANYFPTQKGSQFWTSDAYAPNPQSAWGVYYYGGYTVSASNNSFLSVSLVRSGP